MAKEDPIKRFKKWVQIHISRVPSTSDQFLLDGQAATLEELITKFLDRSDLVSHLKGLQGEDTTAADWSVPKAALDFMAASERDVRIRFRRRVDSLSNRGEFRSKMVHSLKAMLDSLATAAAGPQTSSS